MAKIEEIDTIANFNVREHCRTCSSHFDESILIPAFDEIEITTKTSTEFQLADELISLNVQIEKDDGLPQQLCINCVAQITKIHTFRLVCKEAQVKLKKLVSSNSFHLCSTNDGSKAQHGRDTTKFEIEGKKSDKTNLKFPLESKYNGSQVLDYHEIAREEPDLTACDTYFQDCDSVEDDIGEDNGEKEVLIHNEVDVAGEEASMNKTKKETSSFVLRGLSDLVKMCYDCNKYKHSSRYRVDGRNCEKLQLQNKLQISSDSEFCCFYCDEKFDLEVTIEDHILKCHPKENPFHCKICNEHFSTATQRQRHLEKIHETLKCEGNRQKEHQNPEGEVQKPEGEIQKPDDDDDKFEFVMTKTYFCKLCNKDLLDFNSFRSHNRQHVDGNYQCSVCSKQFTNSYRFDYHIRTHNKSKQFKCQYCDKTFMQWHHRQYHEELHTNRPYICENCGKRFRHQCDYRVHLRQHAENISHVCDVCGKGFPSKRSFHAHKRTHISSNQCETCYEIFETEDDFISHCSTHGHTTGRKKQTRDLEKSKMYHRRYRERSKLESERYACPISGCGKKFSIPAGLKKHLKVHDKKRKFECKECGNFYKTAYHLQAHMNRVHLKIRPYDCPECEKKFYDKSSLNFHLNSHMDKYKCSYCNKEYSKKYIKTHEGTHTKNKYWICGICGESFYYHKSLTEHNKSHTVEEIKEMEAKILAENIDLIKQNE